MKENRLKRLIDIEKEFFPTEVPKMKKFVNYKFLWIRKKPWPFGLYKLLSQISGIKAFPTKKIKYWFLVLLGKKEFVNLVGLLNIIPFKSSKKLPLLADVYFDKGATGIALYLSANRQTVLKFKQTTNKKSVDRALSEEIKSQRSAYTIKHENVFIPKLLKVFLSDEQYCFEQELIIAQNLGRKSKEQIAENVSYVFDFIYLFYKKHGVTLQNLNNNKYINHQAVEEYISSFEYGTEQVRIFKELLQKDKKMLWGRIHGDLSMNNILLDKKNRAWIIDWGKSKNYYLAQDLRNSNYDASELFDKLIGDNNFNKEDIYSLQEQIFIEDFIRLSKMVSKHLKRTDKSSRLPELVKASISRLNRMNL